MGLHCLLRPLDCFLLLVVSSPLATLFGLLRPLLRLPFVARLPCLAGIDGKPRRERIEGGIGLYLGRIEVELATPDQSRLLALLDNGLKESPKDRQAVAQADARERRMVGQRLVEVVPQIPAHAQPICGQP